MKATLLTILVIGALFAAVGWHRNYEQELCKLNGGKFLTLEANSIYACWAADGTRIFDNREAIR